MQYKYFLDHHKSFCTVTYSVTQKIETIEVQGTHNKWYLLRTDAIKFILQNKSSWLYLIGGSAVSVVVVLIIANCRPPLNKIHLAYHKIHNHFTGEFCFITECHIWSGNSWIKVDLDRRSPLWYHFHLWKINCHAVCHVDIPRRHSAGIGFLWDIKCHEISDYLFEMPFSVLEHWSEEMMWLQIICICANDHQLIKPLCRSLIWGNITLNWKCSVAVLMVKLLNCYVSYVLGET